MYIVKVGILCICSNMVRPHLPTRADTMVWLQKRFTNAQQLVVKITTNITKTTTTTTKTTTVKTIKITTNTMLQRTTK